MSLNIDLQRMFDRQEDGGQIRHRRIARGKEHAMHAFGRLVHRRGLGEVEVDELLAPFMLCANRRTC